MKRYKIFNKFIKEYLHLKSYMGILKVFIAKINVEYLNNLLNKDFKEFYKVTYHYSEDIDIRFIRSDRILSELDKSFRKKQQNFQKYFVLNKEQFLL